MASKVNIFLSLSSFFFKGIKKNLHYFYCILYCKSYNGSLEPTNGTELKLAQGCLLFKSHSFRLLGIQFQKGLQIMIFIFHEIHFRCDSFAMSKNRSVTVVSIATNSSFEAIFEPLIQDFVGHIVNVSGLIDHILNVITLKLDTDWNVSSLHFFHAPV